MESKIDFILWVKKTNKIVFFLHTSMYAQISCTNNRMLHSIHFNRINSLEKNRKDLINNFQMYAHVFYFYEFPNILNISRKIFSVNWAIEDSSENSSKDSNVLKNSGKLQISHVALVSYLFASNPHTTVFFFWAIYEFSASFLAFTQLWQANASAIFTPSSRTASWFLSSSAFPIIPLFHSLVYALFKAQTCLFFLTVGSNLSLIPKYWVSSYHWISFEDCSLCNSYSFFYLPTLEFGFFFFLLNLEVFCSEGFLWNYWNISRIFKWIPEGHSS